MRWIAVAMLLLMGCSSAPMPRAIELPTVAVPASMFEQESVRNCFDEIEQLAGHGRYAHERAAFLVVNDENRFDCVLWPASFQHQSERWRGAIPRGTAAIAHTHPREFPNPSAGDSELAQQLGIPVFVLTPSGVTAAEGGGAPLNASYLRRRSSIVATTGANSSFTRSASSK
jgi:hypothetical protein